MTKIRRLSSRFKPVIEEDKAYLDGGEIDGQWRDAYWWRAEKRKPIQGYGDVLRVLEQPYESELTEEQYVWLRKVTQSDAHDTQINALQNAVQACEDDYFGILARLSPYSLTAFHELMNPHEVPASHHIWLCERLEKVAFGEIATLLLSMPAGAAKSTYASRTFAQWYLGLYPHRNILAVGNQQKFVEFEFSKKNREAMRNPRYQMAFPDVAVNESSKGTQAWQLVDPRQTPPTPWRGTYYARGAGAATLGIRANLILGDDLFGQAEDALSEVVRNNVWQWWTADIGSRMLPDCATILVNTRYHSEDPIGQIEKIHTEQPGVINGPVEIINIPAEADKNDPLGRDPGEWLWCKDELHADGTQKQPDGFYPKSHYFSKRATMSPGLWSAVYMGQPLDQFGEFIEQEQFTRYDRYPINSPDRVIEWTKTIISCDTAAKGKERSDNTAILVFRVGVSGYHYVVDCWAGKEPLEKIIQRLNRMGRMWEASKIILEDSGMGATILESYIGKMHCPLQKYTPSGKGAKDFRFDNSTPWITSGKTLFPKQSSWVTKLINEMVAFPNGSADDQVDAFSQFYDSEFKTRKGGTKKARTSG